MDTPREQARSRGSSAGFSLTFLGVVITLSGVMLSAVFFAIQAYVENSQNQQALSQRISSAEATLLDHIYDIENNIIVTRNEIVNVREEIIEIRAINEGVAAKLDVLGIKGRIIEEGTGNGN